MAEVIGLFFSACVTVAKMIYDEIRRIQDQAREELIRAERELMSATGCGGRRPTHVSDSDSDEEEEPVAVQTKKPQRVAILVVAVAIASHILRRKFKE
jgi:hypothetical protein